jgi:hypothetical protein
MISTRNCWMLPPAIRVNRSLAEVSSLALAKSPSSRAFAASPASLPLLALAPALASPLSSSNGLRPRSECRVAPPNGDAATPVYAETTRWPS